MLENPNVWRGSGVGNSAPWGAPFDPSKRAETARCGCRSLRRRYRFNTDSIPATPDWMPPPTDLMPTIRAMIPQTRRPQASENSRRLSHAGQPAPPSGADGLAEKVDRRAAQLAGGGLGNVWWMGWMGDLGMSRRRRTERRLVQIQATDNALRGQSRMPTDLWRPR